MHVLTPRIVLEHIQSEVMQVKVYQEVFHHNSNWHLLHFPNYQELGEMEHKIYIRWNFDVITFTS